MFAIVLSRWGLVWRNRPHFLLCCPRDHENVIWPRVWAPDCLIDWMTDWLTDWPTNWKNCTRFVTLCTSDSTWLSDCDLSIWVAVTASCYPSSKQSDRSCLDWYNFVCPHPKCSFEISCFLYRLALYELYSFVSVYVSLLLSLTLCSLRNSMALYC
jgi:hypothetical protein